MDDPISPLEIYKESILELATSFRWKEQLRERIDLVSALISGAPKAVVLNLLWLKPRLMFWKYFVLLNIWLFIGIVFPTHSIDKHKT